MSEFEDLHFFNDLFFLLESQHTSFLDYVNVVRKSHVLKAVMNGISSEMVRKLTRTQKVDLNMTKKNEGTKEGDFQRLSLANSSLLRFPQSSLPLLYLPVIQTRHVPAAIAEMWIFFQLLQDFF
jgi:hypothetical protein